MEGGSGLNFVLPSTSVDKSRVLDVQPLRCLVPVFSSPPQGPPIVSVPPFGLFPAGFSPFYPFSVPQGFQRSPDLDENSTMYATNQTPQGSIPTPVPINLAGSNGDMQKKAKKRKDPDMGSSKKFVNGISLSLRDDGNREIFNYVLMAFDGLRRRLSQLEDSKEVPTGLARRADLKAGNILMSKGLRTNMRKRIGSVPGVEIGDIFFFRMELCVSGLHSQSMAGIDYMIVKGDSGDEPVALSIVSSGGYDNDAEDRDVLIYSGQGGNVNNTQAADQKLERGNLALERSLHRANEVRVIRGIKDKNSPVKVYVYDGLYTIQDSWVEKEKSGCNIFKYKLLRIPNQPGAYAVWKSVQKWREALSSRCGVMLLDITSGAESIPVSLVNDVDDEKGPAYFAYFPTLKYSKPFNLPHPSFGCNCYSACRPGDPSCSCTQKNGGDFPYTAHGVLVSRKPLIHECGPTCPCFPNCKNRVSQTGLKVRLEVFKTKDRGWGLRSWDPIRAGTFICEYAGEVVDKVNTNQSGEYVLIPPESMVRSSEIMNQGY